MNTANQVVTAKMGLPDLLPAILQLPAFEKVRLIRILAETIEFSAASTGSVLLPSQVYYLHTPVFADGAAGLLMKLLEETPLEN